MGCVGCREGWGVGRGGEEWGVETGFQGEYPTAPPPPPPRINQCTLDCKLL